MIDTWHLIGHLILYWLVLLLSIHVLYIISVLLQYILSSYAHICYMHMHVHLSLYSYTLIRSLSNDPGFTHPYIGYFTLLIRYSMIPDMSRGAWSYPRLDHRYSWFLSFCRSLFSCLSLSSSYSISMFIVIFCGHLYVYCSDHDLL